jgi:hypothetical protein
MPFAIRNLSVLAYAQGFTLWHYRAGRARLDDVSAAGFFDAARDMMAAGDMVMLTAADGGRILCVAGTAGAVTVAPLS